MLDRLVLADRAAEDDALLGVARRAFQCGAADADRLRRNEYALRIHAVQDVFEAASLFADPVLGRDAQSVDEQRIRIDGLAPHLVDLVHGDEGAIEPRVEQRQSESRLRALFEWRRAR